MAGELNKNTFRIHVAFGVENGPESVELAGELKKNAFVHVASSDKPHLFALAPQLRKIMGLTTAAKGLVPIFCR